MESVLSFRLATRLATLAMALVVPHYGALAGSAAAIDPTSPDGPAVNAPLAEPPSEAGNGGRAWVNKAYVAGTWTDNYSFKWKLEQAATTVTGNVITVNCGSWSVTGRVTGENTFNLTARHPTGGGTGCAGSFRYEATKSDVNAASGSWSNSAGLTGNFTMTRNTRPVPKDFVQDGAGSARPGAVLHFEYKWKSSTGDLADLSNCRIGEFVKYPGAADPYVWPSPPWAAGGGTPNPTIIWLDATDGQFEDNHSSKGFLKPYESAAFTANQKYRYQCGSDPIVVFPGWGNIDIARRVSDTTGEGCWKYRITKSGASALRTLPGVPPISCTKSKATTVAQNVSDGNNSDGISLSVSLPDPSVGLHEPIFADLKIVNDSKEAVRFDLGLNKKANLLLAIETPAGTKETRRLRSEGLGSVGRVVLGPDGTYKQRLLLNEWYDFTNEGTYRATMTLDGAAAGGDRPAAKFSVTIGPRNAARLQAIANQLADKAIAGATYAERRAAAESLSFIDDPVAVDSLIRVLQEGLQVGQQAAIGLGRIGTPKALSALGTATRLHPDEDVRTTASSVLKARQRGQSRPEAAD